MKFAATVATLATIACVAIARPLNESPEEKEKSCKNNFAGKVDPCNIAWDECLKIAKDETIMDDCMAFLAAQAVHSVEDATKAIALYQQIPNRDAICQSYLPGPLSASCDLPWKECLAITKNKEEIEDCVGVMVAEAVVTEEDAKRTAENWLRRASESRNPRPEPSPVEVPKGLITVGVYVHVLGPENSTGTEFVLSRDAINKQMDALNKGFESAQITFKIKDVAWHIKTSGLRIDDEKRKFHQGNLTTLNLFFEERDPTRAGTTHVPYFTSVLFEEKLDGMVVNSNTVPGGPHPTWNEGVTVIHEAGHWFNLPHTSYTGAADCVPENRNVPITSDNACGNHCDFNFMSYGDDACLREFTPKQIAAMRIFAVTQRGLVPS